MSAGIKATLVLLGMFVYVGLVYAISLYNKTIVPFLVVPVICGPLWYALYLSFKENP